MMAESIGGNPFLVQRLLGHKDSKTSARYCHLKSGAAKVIDIAPYLNTGMDASDSEGTAAHVAAPTGTEGTKKV
jgi:hypothetical protein